MNKIYLDINKPIVPNSEIGGFYIGSHIFLYVDIIKCFSNIDRVSLQETSVNLIGQFIIRYTLNNSIILSFNIVTGKLTLVSALGNYKGLLFNKIGIGTSISEAIKYCPNLYYDAFEEGYYIQGTKGIALFLEDPYSDHTENGDNKIVEISVYDEELLILP